MIYLTTGQPGAGKTLWSINYVKQLAEKENRQVYYSGINNVKITGWIELDNPEQWHTLPPGAIIVIDECQRLFRPRSVGSNVPEYVQALETHRHQGHDLFLVTQHPMLVESNVRRLVGTHWHVMRVFGAQRATVHEFNGYKQEPDKSREGSVRHEWSYPKEVFDLYSSAQIHTHKARVPMRVWMVAAAPLVLIALGYVAWDQLTGSESTVAQLEQDGLAQLAVPASPAAPSASGQLGTITKAAYLEAAAPRIDGLAFTAPKYDELQKPEAAPKPASCIRSSSKGCKCYTQQATPLDVPEAVCQQIVQGGWFDDTQESIYKQKKNGKLPESELQPPAREGGGNSAA